MIVQCAACQARFKISDDKVTDRGVKVRCRKCATVFVVRKESAPPPDAPPLGRAGPEPATRPGMNVPPPLPAAGAQNPFRRFQTNEIPGAAAFGRPAAAARPDPFAGLSPAAPAKAPADPFAAFSLAPPAPPAPAPPAPAARSTAADPFADLDLAAMPGAQPKASADPFANIDMGFPPASSPAPAPAAPPRSSGGVLGLIGASQAPTVGPSAPPRPTDDPFASLQLGPSKPAPVAIPAAAIPSVPSALDLGNIELGPKDPGLDDEPPGTPLEEPSPAAPAMEPQDPPTVVKNVRWKGGDADRVEVQSPAAAYAGQLLAAKPTKERPRRSLALSLLAALAFLAVGGLVLERTARAIRAAQGITSSGATLDCRPASSGFYPTRDGRAAFLVRGKIENRGERQGPAVKVTVELRRGSTVERTAEAFVGAAPTPEELYLTGPLEVSDMLQRVAAKAGPLAAHTAGDFLAVFSEYPEDIADLSLHVAAAAAAPPPAPAAKAVEPTRPEPTPVPAPEPKGSAKGAPDKAKGPEFPMDDPKRPLKLNSGQPAAGPDKAKAPEFPMDDPKRPLKVNSGAPAAAPGKAPAPVPGKAPAPAPASEKKQVEFPMDDPKRPLKVNSGPAPAPAKP